LAAVNPANTEWPLFKDRMTERSSAMCSRAPRMAAVEPRPWTTIVESFERRLFTVSGRQATMGEQPTGIDSQHHIARIRRRLGFVARRIHGP